MAHGNERRSICFAKSAKQLETNRKECPETVTVPDSAFEGSERVTASSAETAHPGARICAAVSREGSIRDQYCQLLPT
jgi:hypothetical protein